LALAGTDPADATPIASRYRSLSSWSIQDLGGSACSFIGLPGIILGIFISGPRFMR
jgi:hypothetical protein